MCQPFPAVLIASPAGMERLKQMKSYAKRAFLPFTGEMPTW